ncbi:MAG: hypothetical protein AB2637_13150 [Candidatus Thiodiazotropha sp.]|jgi:hypothetical protein
MDDKEQRLLDFLLADFNSAKNEISRRSNLQKAVIASMLVFYAWLFQLSFSNGLELPMVVLVWIVSFLGYTFYIRESSEIKRLGWTIKEKIAKPTGAILGHMPEEVIPTEAHATKPSEIGWHVIISVVFKISIYLVAPLYLTGTYLCKTYGT